MITDGICIQAIFPKQLLSCSHLSALNSLGQEELELNTLVMSCSSVIRLTHAGNFLHGYYSTCSQESWLTDRKTVSIAASLLTSGFKNILFLVLV